MLTPYEWTYGIAQLAVVFLSVVAGILALSMFKAARQRAELKAWKLLIPALVLFALVEIMGMLRTFGIWEPHFLTHMTVSVLLAFVIAALVAQRNVSRGWVG